MFIDHELLRPARARRTRGPTVILGLGATLWLASCAQSSDEPAELGESSSYVIGGNLDCTGLVSLATITGNVKVAPGASCILIDVTVGGNIEAAENSNLALHDTSVNGHLIAHAARSVTIEPITSIGHNLELRDSGSVIVSGTVVGGQLIIEGTSGKLAGGNNSLCGSTIAGNVTIKGSALGAPFDVGTISNCRGNTINGKLKLEDNAGTVTLTENSFQDKVTCAGHSGGSVEVATEGVVVLSASCAAKQCVPGCAGQLLTACDEQANPTHKDCHAQLDSAGSPMTCQFLEDLQDFDCIGDFDGGCGDETLEGRCVGSTYIHCFSEDSGNAGASGETPIDVEVVDCAHNPAGLTTCAVAPDGQAGCAAPGTTGCGDVPTDGECDGDVLTRCVGSSVQTTNCGLTGARCGLANDDNYACLDASLFEGASASPAFGPVGILATTGTVTGRFVFEKRVVDTSSFTSARRGFLPTTVLLPARRILVQLVQESNGQELLRSFTDDNGAFSLTIPDVTIPTYVIVASSGDPTRYPLTVRNCPPSPAGTFPAGCTDGLGGVYRLRSGTFTGSTALGQLSTSVGSGFAGAFNIFDQVLRAEEFARVNFNGGNFPATPAALVEWKRGFETVTSYATNEMLVIQGNGTGGDTDEYDDPVLMHEFGHFLQKKFSVSSSPGGSHNGSPADPRLAFSEGYGTYVGCRISGSSIYFDTDESGTSVTDINNTGRPKANPDDPYGIKQLLSEYVVGEILWRLDLGTGGDTVGAGATNGQGSAPVFDVLGKYFKNNPEYNDTHGVPGRDLVKFLDGWFCRDFGAKAFATTSILQGVVTTDHGFPYDDFEHLIAEIGSCK